MKVILVAWLVLPQFRGAAFLYERFVREKLRQNNGIHEVNGDHVSSSSSSPKKHKKRFLAFVTSKKVSALLDNSLIKFYVINYS